MMRPKSNRIPEQYRPRFTQRLHDENYQRLKIIPIVITFFCVLYLLQYEFAPGMENKSEYFHYYVFLFVSMGVISIISRAGLPILHKKTTPHVQKIFFIAYTYLLFLFCICLTILDLMISNDYSAYALGAVGLSFVLRISFRKIIIMITSGFFLFLAGIMIFSDRTLDINLVLPIFVFNIFSIFISFSLWGTRKKLYALRYELEEKNKELKETTFRDPLTRLYNRRFMIQSLLKLIAGFKRSRIPFSIQILDIDYFKKVNDKAGHSAGDNVLTEISGLLKKNSRDTDFVARYGGEEFIIVSPGTDKKKIFLQAERIRKQIEKHQFTGISWNITTSIGISEINEGDDEASLIERADQNLYIAKKSGRNCTRG